MKLEQQVCSLELAKKLKGLGVKQESLFYYYVWLDKMGAERMQGIYQGVFADNITGRDYAFYSAFTVAELGEMLPEHIFKKGRLYIIKTHEGEEFWQIYYRNQFGISIIESAATEADARAKMLIYLIENKLWTPSA